MLWDNSITKEQVIILDDFNFYGLGDFVHRYDFKDKKRNISSYVIYMINRTMQMFDYENLPETIPKKMLELYTMVNGHSVVLEHKDSLYVCFGGFAGEPNEYYIPKQYIVANPYLKLFDTFDIDVNCVLVQNDTMMLGLMPMYRKYATALVENDLSMNILDIQSRIVSLIDARDDSTRASAKKYLDDIERGENGVIASNQFFDGVRAQPYAQTSHSPITDLIEYQQYIKASWFNDIGLNANYNMKRESINSNEAQLNDDMLLPLIDDMLECRQDAVDKINAMFGTNITVSYASAWEDNIIELESEQDMMGGDNDDTENAGENDVPPNDTGERDNE